MKQKAFCNFAEASPEITLSLWATAHWVRCVWQLAVKRFFPFVSALLRRGARWRPCYRIELVLHFLRPLKALKLQPQTHTPSNRNQNQPYCSNETELTIGGFFWKDLTWNVHLECSTYIDGSSIRYILIFLYLKIRKNHYFGWILFRLVTTGRNHFSLK